MSTWQHRIYMSTMVAITLACTTYLGAITYDYLQTPIDERFYHPHYDLFKPSGLIGHGLGIIGTLFITIGVVLYIARKRYGFMERFIRLKYLLEFHIFLCVLGPILILFHTTLKFGGVVSIAFWSMALVVLSGFIGRYIFVRIPRSETGEAYSHEDIIEIQENGKKMIDSYLSSDRDKSIILHIKTRSRIPIYSAILKAHYLNKLKKSLISKDLDSKTLQDILITVTLSFKLNNQLKTIEKMKKWFKYWHVAHLPFAIIMLFIVIIHVGITLLMGYTWIF